MKGLFTTPFAKLLKFNLFRDCFFVFGGPIINALTGSAGKFYKPILRHTAILY